MRRFEFRLDRVLRLRQQELEAARRTLAGALAAEEAARRGLAAIRAHKATELGRLMRQEAAGLTAADFAGWRQHLGRIARAEAAAEQDLAAATRRVAEARTELLDRRRQARVLEKLRERQMEQYRAEAARAEQAELDELAVRRP